MGKKYTVYILECADGSFYTGITKNLHFRLQQYSLGLPRTNYTASRLPVRLVFQQEFGSPQEAIAAEKRIKKWRREKKIALIEGRFSDLPALAKAKSKDRQGE